MRTRLLGAACAALAFAAGARWWAALVALRVVQVPGRLAPLGGAVAAAALLPWARLELASTLLAFATGIAAAWAVLARLGPGLPWVALPWFAALLLAGALLWGVLPPAGFWEASDVAVRARLVSLAAALIIACAVTYLPRYPGTAPDPQQPASGKHP